MAANDAETGRQTEYSEFKAFLSSERPPLKLFKATHSALMYVNEGKWAKYDVPHEGAVQPGTFYIKMFGDGFAPLSEAPLETVGAGRTSDWSIDGNGQVAVGGPDPREEAASDPVQKKVENHIKIVEDILALGILYLDRGTISWSNNTFQAQTRDVNWGMISGDISGGDGIRPESLDFHYSGMKDYQYKAIYHYDNDGRRPAWMPHVILLYASSPQRTQRQNSLAVTNTILDLAVGFVKLGANGYDYKDFIPAGDVLTTGNFLVYSNGAGRILIGNHFETFSVAQKDEMIVNPVSRQRARLVFFTIGILTLGGGNK